MLEVRGLSAGYGNFEVLHRVDLEVPSRQIVGLLGHNGAGKSTLLKAIFGVVPAAEGRVVFSGSDTTRARSFEKASLGIRFVPQEGNTFPTLSVEENLRLGAVKLDGGSRAFAERLQEIYGIFRILQERRLAPARVLSGGERQMLAISIALMTAPRLLLLDEPSAGLSPIMVQRLFDMIQEIHRRFGTAVLLVEQNVNEALRIAERVYVLQEGSIVFHGGSREKEQIIRTLWRLAADHARGKLPP